MPTGMLGTVQLAAQSSYGTSNVVSLRGFPVISETLKHTIAQLQETQMYGRYGDSPRYSDRLAERNPVATT